YYRGSQAALESIVTNLMNNSIFWLEKSSATKLRIVIRTQLQDGFATIRVLDNGQGIEDISKEDIWLPGMSTRPKGTGLGLTIVRDTANDLGGEVDAVEHGELGGAEIIIRLPILGA